MMIFKYESIFTILIVFKIGFLKADLIGERCRYDDDCIVDNSYCEMQQICECKNNFIASEDGEICIALVGAHCHSKYDCTSLPNSVCKDDNCVCDQGYVPDAQQTKCIPIAQQIKDVCEHDSQCRARLGYQSHCFNRQCDCLPGYHFERQCVISKGLHEQCWNSSQCFIGEDQRNKIICSSGNCLCAPGYHEIVNLCIENGSSSMLGGYIILIMTSILMIFSL